MFTDPVVGKDFFGREETLQLLLKRARALRQGYRQNVALLGPELIGKTSLLQQFMTQFNDPQTLVVYFEFRHQESFEEFVERFKAVFLYAVLRRFGKGPYEQNGVAFQRFQELAPQTASWLKGLLDKKEKANPTEIFRSLLELSSRAGKEMGKGVILILDEFDRLLEFGIHEPFSHLGRQIMIQKETLYLLASSQVVLAQMILRQRLSLLFGHFERVTVEPFAPQVALDYLERRWGLTPLDLKVKQFLIFLTGGRPFYLNVLGQHLSALPPADLNHPGAVLSVLEKVLFSAQGILNQYLTMRVSRVASSDPSGKSMLMLQSLSRGACSSREIRRLFKNPRDVSQKLERLVEEELVSKNGVFYRIHDRLFSFWFRTCFEKKTHALSGNISEQSSAFRKEAEEVMKYFLESLRKDLTQKILNLFGSFKGERIEIDQKSHRLPHFSEVQHSKGKGGNVMIVGRKGKGSWVSAFFEHEMTEEEVAEFIKRCQSLNRPIYQKILSPLGGMDDNARLLAKKERVWMWELESVNLLLDLFGHGPILNSEEKRRG